MFEITSDFVSHSMGEEEFLNWQILLIQIIFLNLMPKVPSYDLIWTWVRPGALKVINPASPGLKQ
jgi:hypothetical protein